MTDPPPTQAIDWEGRYRDGATGWERAGLNPSFTAWRESGSAGALPHPGARRRPQPRTGGPRRGRFRRHAGRCLAHCRRDAARPAGAAARQSAGDAGGSAALGPAPRRSTRSTTRPACAPCRPPSGRPTPRGCTAGSGPAARCSSCSCSPRAPAARRSTATSARCGELFPDDELDLARDAARHGRAFARHRRATGRAAEPLKTEERTMDGGFEPALQTRTQDVLDNCTACGRCVEVCPMPGPAGLDAADAPGIAAGVLAILRGDNPPGCVGALGLGLLRQRALHPGLPARGEPALHADHGAAGHAAPQRRRDAPQGRVLPLHRHDHRRARAVAPATAARTAGTLPARRRRPRRRAARRGLLHRLQPAQDAAHRPAVLRHHGRDGAALPRHGRAVALLRRAAIPRRRPGDLRPHRLPHRGAARQRRRPRADLVPDLPGAARRGGDARPVRPSGADAVPALPGGAAGRPAPSAAPSGAQARRPARAPGRRRRRRKRPRRSCA